MGHGEATLAAAQHSAASDYRIIHVPGAVHHDRPRGGVAVARVESLETQRTAVTAEVDLFGAVGTRRGRIGTWLVGEALEPAGVLRVGALAVRDQIGSEPTVRRPQQMKSGRPRG